MGYFNKSDSGKFFITGYICHLPVQNCDVLFDGKTFDSFEAAWDHILENVEDENPTYTDLATREVIHLDEDYSDFDVKHVDWALHQDRIAECRLYKLQRVAQRG